MFRGERPRTSPGQLGHFLGFGDCFGAPVFTFAASWASSSGSAGISHRLA
jgi:hypothetical protein